MDYVTEDWPPKLIRNQMDLTDTEIDGVMRSIKDHCVEVESEYEQVLKQAEQECADWEARNRERFAETAALPCKPDSLGQTIEQDARPASLPVLTIANLR